MKDQIITRPEWRDSFSRAISSGSNAFVWQETANYVLSRIKDKYPLAEVRQNVDMDPLGLFDAIDSYTIIDSRKVHVPKVEFGDGGIFSRSFWKGKVRRVLETKVKNLVTATGYVEWLIGSLGPSRIWLE